MKIIKEATEGISWRKFYKENPEVIKRLEKGVRKAYFSTSIKGAKSYVEFSENNLKLDCSDLHIQMGSLKILPDRALVSFEEDHILKFDLKDSSSIFGIKI